MVNPRVDCDVAPDLHATRRLLRRGLAFVDLERIIREGSWRPEGGNQFDVVYGRWHLKVRVGRCTLMVSTVFPEARR